MDHKKTKSVLYKYVISPENKNIFVEFFVDKLFKEYLLPSYLEFEKCYDVRITKHVNIEDKLFGYQASTQLIYNLPDKNAKNYILLLITGNEDEEKEKHVINIELMYDIKSNYSTHTIKVLDSVHSMLESYNK